MLKFSIYKILWCFLFCTNTFFSQSDSTNIKTLQVSPDLIEVGIFFNGTQVRVTAEMSGCSDVVVKLVGKDETLILNKKEKKALFWLNVAKDTVKYAPSIYILACTNELDELCKMEDREKEMLGYNALKENILFKSSLPLTGEEFSEFIKLKEHNGCYKIYKGATIKSESDEKQVLNAYLNIPSFIPVDEYNVVVYCFQNGLLTDKSVADLKVKKVGLPLFISNLANNSPALYGILAIIAAMSAGILIGMIFSKKRNR